ncbi:hypothetical protein SUGI_0269260 [Cryptomeria japonica]|nr:hypothetical protein SUGI_0269260 [Cryptomeria japonica]
MREGIVVKLQRSGSGKVVELVATQDSKLDMGSIAATFGLNPLSLNLNGLYISRGPDFISSCLTWNDVLRYFANKGYPTGISHQHPIIVDGNTCQGSRFNFNCSGDSNPTNSKAMAIGDKRKMSWEGSTSANMPKKRKTIEDNVVGSLTISKTIEDIGTNDKHSQDFGGKYDNCYTKRGRDEDLGEMHAKEKKRCALQISCR